MRSLPPIVLFAALLLLCACISKPPEIPLTEVPAAPLLRALEQRRQAFAGLKAVAAVDAVRKGRKRSFDNVGIVLADQNRLRLEAYGPLGQSLLVLTWDGKEVLYRQGGQAHIMRPGAAGLEWILGANLDMQELCAALAGNIPEVPATAGIAASCGRGNVCVLTISQGEAVRRVQVLFRSSGAEPELTPLAQELFHNGKLVYRVRFEQRAAIAQYHLPQLVVLENPDKGFSLTVRYGEAEVNVPIEQELFTLSDEGRTEGAP